MKFCVLYGSQREHRLGIRLANYLIQQLERRGHEVYFMDALKLDLPVLDKRYSDYPVGEAPEKLKEISHKLSQADGFVLVSGEYNHSMQPGLKNMLDMFTKEYYFRPSAIASYSISDFGGLRSEMSLLPITHALHMPTIPASFIVPRIHEALSEHGMPLNPAIPVHAEKFINQLEWYARALQTERLQGLPQ